ncbi:MAG TPA: hypothetical protein VGL81_23585 [Polyangiaceae bacterium]|jgi:hypothetical protein
MTQDDRNKTRYRTALVRAGAALAVVCAWAVLAFSPAVAMLILAASGLAFLLVAFQASRPRAGRGLVPQVLVLGLSLLGAIVLWHSYDHLSAAAFCGGITMVVTLAVYAIRRLTAINSSPT